MFLSFLKEMLPNCSTEDTTFSIAVLTERQTFSSQMCVLKSSPSPSLGTHSSPVQKGESYYCAMLCSSLSCFLVNFIKLNRRLLSFLEVVQCLPQVSKHQNIRFKFGCQHLFHLVFVILHKKQKIKYTAEIKKTTYTKFPHEKIP